MVVKINKRQRADFEFLLNSEVDELVTGDLFKTPVCDPEGYSALECFVAKDTHGKILPCREPEQLNTVGYMVWMF